MFLDSVTTVKAKGALHKQTYVKIHFVKTLFVSGCINLITTLHHGCRYIDQTCRVHNRPIHILQRKSCDQFATYLQHLVPDSNSSTTLIGARVRSSLQCSPWVLSAFGVAPAGAFSIRSGPCGCFQHSEWPLRALSAFGVAPTGAFSIQSGPYGRFQHSEWPLRALSAFRVAPTGAFSIQSGPYGRFQHSEWPLRALSAFRVAPTGAFSIQSGPYGRFQHSEWPLRALSAFRVAPTGAFSIQSGPYGRLGLGCRVVPILCLPQ